MEQSEVEPVDPEIREKYSVIWLNENPDELERNNQDCWTRLCRNVRNVHVFGDPRKCIDVLIDEERTSFFLVISDGFAQELIRAIHSYSNVVAIYILNPNSNNDESWTKSWSKIKGIYHTIESIHEDLYMTINKHQENYEMSDVLPLIHYVTESPPNQIDLAFAWNKMLMKIVREMHYDERSKTAFVNYMREKLPASHHSRRVLDEFERDYRPDTAIWRYTQASFICPTLDQALKFLEIDAILHFGFFIRDLCNQIEQLHHEQIDGYDARPFTAYCGQGLPMEDFEKMTNNIGGFISFNTILYSSSDVNVARLFAESSSVPNQSQGILFIMTIDPTLNCASFADVRYFSDFSQEAPILFNPNTCFRIERVTLPVGNDQVVEVSLTLTDARDQPASRLCDDLENTLNGLTEIERLNELLIYMNKPEAMEKINSVVADQLIWNQEQMCLSHYYSGISQILQGNYQLALEHLEENLSSDYSKRVAIHLAIGNAYRLLGNYAKALDFHSKSCDLATGTDRQHHSKLSKIFNGLGLVYYDMGDYSRALSLYRKALACQREKPSINILDLSSICDNMGSAYAKLQKYRRALQLHQTSLAARERILLPDHPDLAWSYHNMGIVHQQMGKYSEALYWYTRALDLRLKQCPPDHPDIGAFYHSMGDLYYHMKDYPKALELQQKALGIRMKCFSANHPYVASSFHSLGLTYHSLGKIPTAMRLVEGAFQIRQQVLPPTHPDLITSGELIKCFRYNSRRYLEAMTSWS